MRAPALLATVLLLAFWGCGQSTSSTSGFKGAEAAVAQTVGDLAEAGSKREAGAICGEVVTDALRERLAAGGSSCNSEMQKAIEDVDDFDIEVTDVTIDGDTATARVRSTDRGEAVTRTFELERQDDDWRISAFG